MMTRQQVFAIIEKERQYQDSVYDPEAIVASGQTRAQRDLEIATSITMLEVYIRKAGDAWVNLGSNLLALQRVAKIAAIAVRALERAGGSEKLLTNGLR